MISGSPLRGVPVQGTGRGRGVCGWRERREKRDWPCQNNYFVDYFLINYLFIKNVVVSRCVEGVPLHEYVCVGGGPVSEVLHPPPSCPEPPAQPPSCMSALHCLLTSAMCDVANEVEVV